MYPLGDSRRAEYVQGSGRGVMMTDQGWDSHDMVHMGMGDKNSVDRLDDPLGQMCYLAAIKEQRPLQWPDP